MAISSIEQRHSELFADSFTLESGETVHAVPTDRTIEGYCGDLVISDRNNVRSSLGYYVRGVPTHGRSVTHKQLYVTKDNRGKGFASMWLTRCLKKYEAIGAERVFVHAGNEAGIYTWYRRGFTEVAPSVEARLLGFARAKARRALSELKFSGTLQVESTYRLSSDIKTLLRNGSHVEFKGALSTGCTTSELWAPGTDTPVSRDLEQDRVFLTEVLQCQTLAELFALDAPPRVPMAGCGLRDWRTALLSGKYANMAMSLN